MNRISIIQGEHAVVSQPNTIVTTLLGSCIAVCLQDPVARVGGMNHFLLGEPNPNHAVSMQDMQRYGIHAMELLINGMMQKGAVRSRLRAHLYGGANITAGLRGIGSSNAEFARRYATTEGITLGHVDVGGHHARRVEFLPFEGKARAIAVRNQSPPLPPLPLTVPVVSAGELELF